MAEKSDKQKLSMANTKKEMLQAYNELLEQLREEREADLKPEQKAEEKKTQEAVKKADSLSVDSLMKNITDVKLQFGKTVSQLSEMLETEMNNYEKVKEAFAAKEKELKDIYEIEREASSLNALIQAQKQRKEQFEKEMQDEREEFEAEMEQKRSDWEKEKKTAEVEAKEFRENLKKQQQREKEEFEYQFNLEKKQAQDKFNEDKAAMERELKEMRENAEKDLAERERNVAEKEQELNELRKKVDEFPAVLDSEIQKAVDNATEKLKMDAEHKEKMLTAEFDGERKVLNTKIESLEKTIKDQEQQIRQLADQLGKSYDQVQNIAVKAVEGSHWTKSGYERNQKTEKKDQEE